MFTGSRAAVASALLVVRDGGMKNPGELGKSTEQLLVCWGRLGHWRGLMGLNEVMGSSMQHRDSCRSGFV